MELAFSKFHMLPRKHKSKPCESFLLIKWTSKIHYKTLLVSPLKAPRQTTRQNKHPPGVFMYMNLPEIWREQQTENKIGDTITHSTAGARLLEALEERPGVCSCLLMAYWVPLLPLAEGSARSGRPSGGHGSPTASPRSRCHPRHHTLLQFKKMPGASKKRAKLNWS